MSKILLRTWACLSISIEIQSSHEYQQPIRHFEVDCGHPISDTRHWTVRSRLKEPMQHSLASPSIVRPIGTILAISIFMGVEKADANVVERDVVVPC